MEAARCLHNLNSLLRTIDRQYDDQYARAGDKIGPTLQIRLPVRVKPGWGPTIKAQSTQETSVTLAMARRQNIPLMFQTQDLLLTIDQFSDRYIKPSVLQLSTSVEQDMFNMTMGFWNLSGSPGISPASQAPFLDAQTRLNRGSTPKEATKRFAMITSGVQATLVPALQSLFQPAKSIAAQYLDGVVGHIDGFDILTNEICPVHTNGVMAGAATAVVSGAGQTGTTLYTTGWNPGDTVTNGTVFTIPGVYRVNPETRQPYGSDATCLQQFVQASPSNTPIDGPVTWTDPVADASGNMVLTILPGIDFSTNNQTVNAAPAAGAAIQVVGNSATSYPQSICYHKEAMTAVFADLPLPRGVEQAKAMRAKNTDGSIPLRLIEAYNVENDMMIDRLDVLYGYVVVRPEFGGRITG